MRISKSIVFILLCLSTVACKGDFEGKKSNNIAMEPRDLTLVPGSIGTRETSGLIELRNTGEAPLELAEIYIEVDGEAGRERLDACDFETQMIAPGLFVHPLH